MGSFHRNKEDDESLKIKESGTQKRVWLETGSTTVIGQVDAEQRQEFGPSGVNLSRLGPQGVAPFPRTSPKTHVEGARKQKEYSKIVQLFRMTKARKRALRMAEKRLDPLEAPCSSAACLSFQRSEVSSSSDIYTSAGRSSELGSHPESEFIYAESIKGSVSCSGASRDWGSCPFYTEDEKPPCGITRDPGAETADMGSSVEALFGSDSSCDGESTRGDCDSDSSCINADWERSFDSDSDSYNSSAGAQWGSGSSCSGSAASGYVTDYDLESSLSTAGWHDRSASCSHFEAGHRDSVVGHVEATHCDSAVEHFEVGCHDLPVSNYKSSQNLPVGHFDERECDLLVGRFEIGTFKLALCDSPVGHLDSRVGYFEDGYRNSPFGHFKTAQCDSSGSHLGGGHCDFQVVQVEPGLCDVPESHFETVHCDSTAGHFEIEHRKSPVGPFYETGCDSLVGHSETAHCDSPVGHIVGATYDLYNAFLESSHEVCQEQSNFGQIYDSPELTWRKLRGVVTLPDHYRVGAYFHAMMKGTEQNRIKERVKINKGLLFHPQRFLQAKNSEYREGREYSVLRHVQSGSYGDVFSVRDKQTGFTCAAKRIPLSSFSWEEVGTWSRLDSPHVLQLYGAVHEGLNVVLFMDLKTGSLAQLLKASGRFPEDLSLHYHRQVLQALEHLHSRRVIHLDVKVDNVLLSQDKKKCFLCDFGLSEILDQTGYSTKTFRGNGLRGTESHMSPEVARGDPRSDKADVWSSCCMLLHMLSGHQPWTRYYTHPLCLKIVSEPAPLWEIPPECDSLTCDVIRGGLVKEPKGRDSARELLEKSGRALRAVGVLFEPVQSATYNRSCPQISLPIRPHNVLERPPTVFSSATTGQEERSGFIIQWVSGWRERAVEEDGTASGEDRYEDSDVGSDDEERWMARHWGLRTESMLSDGETRRSSEERWRAMELVGEEEEGPSDAEVESYLGSLRELGSEGEWEPFQRLQILCGSKLQRSEDEWSETEEECVPLTTTSLDICESNSRLTLACHRSVCASDAELTGKGSDLSDDLSSGVFSSYSSLTDEQGGFNVDWPVSTNQPPSCCFEGLGVDIWVEDVNGDTFRIRERLNVKLGHVAVGISAQISMKAFSLATLDGKLVSPDTEIVESRTWLLCLPAPDNSPCWTWRIRDGKLETQEADGLQSDTCSTLPV